MQSHGINFARNDSNSIWSLSTVLMNFLNISLHSQIFNVEEIIVEILYISKK